MTLKFSITWFSWIFLFILNLIFFDVITHLFSNNTILTHLFQITVEKNLPTIFATLQLLLSGFLLRFVFSRYNSQKKQHAHYFKYLSYIFYFLAFDEWFSVHDVIGSDISNYLGSFGDVFGWTAFYILLMTLFFIWSIKFLLHLPKQTALYFIGSGTIFLLGAIGFELLNSSGFQEFFNISLSSSSAYSIGLIEESLEMFGIFLFNLTLFKFIKASYSINHITLNTPLFASCLIIFVLDTIITYIVIYL